MVIPNASHTKTLIPTCFVSPIQRGARDTFLCFSQTTWPAHSVLHLAMSWESRNGVETSKLSAPLPCALACRSTYHHPRVEKQNSATAVSKLSHLGAAEKQHSCSSPEKWAFPWIGLPWLFRFSAARTLFPLSPMSALGVQVGQLDPNDIQPILNKEYFYSPANKNSSNPVWHLVSLKCDDIINRWK